MTASLRFGLLLLLLCRCSAESQTLLRASIEPSEGMGSPQSPSATPTFPATITPPVNGDNLSATDLNTNVETPLQNGVEAARLLTRGGHTYRRVTCSSNNVMVIAPIGAVIATVSSVWTAKEHLTASTIDPEALAGALAANTRYYVYVGLPGSVVTFSVSTTAPDVGLFYKTGDTSYMFVSTFITNGVPDIVPYTQSELAYTYGNDSTGGYPTSTIALSAGSSTVGAIVALGLSVPTGAKTAYLLGSINSTMAGRYGDIIDISNGSTYGRAIDQGAVGSICNFPMSMYGGNSVRYVVSDAASQLRIVVQGFSY